MKSPLRASLEPIYRQLQVMRTLSPFVITSVVGQELLAARHYAAAAVVLESALQIGTSSLKLRGSVLSALSSAYWAMNKLDVAIRYMQEDLQVCLAFLCSFSVGGRSFLCVELFAALGLISVLFLCGNGLLCGCDCC